MRRTIFSVLPVFLAVALLQLGGVLQPLQNWPIEQRFAAHERPASSDIVLVEIDPASLDEVGIWPWPRGIHAKGIDELRAAGASEITFDVDFSQKSSPGEDARFEQALEAAGGIVALPAFKQAWSHETSARREHINEPLPRFARHAWMAVVNVYTDTDGKVRELPVGDTIKGKFQPSVAALLGGIPNGVRASFSIDFSIDPATVPRLSFIDVIEERVSPDLIRGKKILIGAGAAELRDQFAVPRRGIMSGPMLQIIGAESILQGRALLHASPVVSFALVVLALFISAFLRIRLAWRWHLGALGLLAALTELAAFAVQITTPTIIETAPLHLAIILAAALLVISEVDIRGLLVRIARAETGAALGMLDQVVADNFDGIIIVNQDLTIISANQSAVEILSLGQEIRREGTNICDVLPQPLQAHIIEVLEACAAGEPATGEPVEVECMLEGEPAVLEMVATPSMSRRISEEPHRGAHEHMIVSLTFRNVTERNRAQARIAYMAHHDTLTRLANRDLLEQKLEDWIARPEAERGALTVIHFDLSRFKNVNQTINHQTGDLLLQTAAERAAALVSGEGFVARLGGDEFVLVQPGIDSLESARSLGETLLECLRAPYELADYRIIVGASAGLVWTPGQGENASQLIRNADAALHSARTAGTGEVGVFDRDIANRLLAHRQLELDLCTAIEREELEVFYQPQVDLATGQLIGAEALVRWNSPTRGYISPAEFIPVAEYIGLIPQFGAWILERACNEAASWPRQLKIAVNLSSPQFTQGDLLATITAALNQSGLEAKQLELEITESLLVDENPTTMAILDTIREMGIGLALDDFGTGYSSLSYITQFPITKIKIDQAFVRGLPGDEDSLAIIRAVSTLSSSLNLRTTVEGIETPEQVELLALTGCDVGQGYLFGKLMPVAEFESLIATFDKDQTLVA